jgi:hypothetical protein
MAMQLCSDQQFPLNSKIHNSLRRPNPPILESIYYLPIRLYLFTLNVPLEKYLL